MPTQVALTNAGAQGLMTSGVPLSGYLQIGRDTLPAADWPTAVAVPGAFRVMSISRAIVATQTIIQALDDEDTEEYDDLASIGFWTADPSTPGAELWALGTAAPGEVLSIKTLNNDLIWTVSLMLTPTQVGNLSFDISIETVPEASETRFGITRYATDTEAQAIEANASDERTATIASLWTWWNALGILASKVPNLDAGKIATGVLTAARIPNLDADKIATGVFTALRIPNLEQNRHRSVHGRTHSRSGRWQNRHRSVRGHADPRVDSPSGKPELHWPAHGAHAVDGEQLHSCRDDGPRLCRARRTGQRGAWSAGHDQRVGHRPR